MKLFKVNLVITREDYLVVAGESQEEVQRWAEAHRSEWGRPYLSRSDEKISVQAVDPVTHPREIAEQGGKDDCLCTDEDRQPTMASAFFHDALQPAYQAKMADEDNDALNEAYYEQEAEYEKKFDEMKNMKK